MRSASRSIRNTSKTIIAHDRVTRSHSSRRSAAAADASPWIGRISDRSRSRRCSCAGSRGRRSPRGRNHVLSSARLARTTSAARSDAWSTRPTRRWRCRRFASSRDEAARAMGDHCASQSRIGSAWWKSARPRWRSRYRRLIAQRRSKHAGSQLIDLKEIVPIWKKEHFEGGEVWIGCQTSHPPHAHAAK